MRDGFDHPEKEVRPIGHLSCNLEEETLSTLFREVDRVISQFSEKKGINPHTGERVVPAETTGSIFVDEVKTRSNEKRVEVAGQKPTA